MLTSLRAALAGRYVLEREVGRGSAAAVYAARDLKHGRRVALKVMHADVITTSGTNRFLQEIRTTASLNHPHILPLFDSGEAEGYIFYSMPLVEGESLRQRIEREGNVPIDTAVTFITQLANALAHAHSLAVVHRDVKPENILIGDRDHLWVADFGLARALASAIDHRLTGTGIAMGSPLYMSPEQAAGERDVDHRSDIYALGCIAFELLSGSPPFTATTVPALLARHLSSPAPSVRQSRADLPASIDTAIARALAKERTARFDSAIEFAAALRGESIASAAPAASVAPVAPVAPAVDTPDVMERIALLLRRLWLEFKPHPPAAEATTEPEPEPQPASEWHLPHLPVVTTPYINRLQEVRDVCDMLRASKTRLVTVTGPGGVGKTRFALHVAAEVSASYRDGVAYTALSGFSSPELLAPSIAESLGVPLSRREDPVNELKAFLQEKEMLLILDNFEHLTAAAGLLPELLDDAPGVRMLVTTRERLRLRHETLVTLDGLSVVEQDRTSHAVDLFVSGARRLDRRFELDDANRADVVRICELLSGLPLAIELASAWIRTLSCGAILAELERDLDVLSNEAPDVEQRHHSMRATFDASWRLLSPAEQVALARLAVFRTAFDSRAASRVADTDARLIRHLVDKSLLARTGDRLHMLDVVRAYALERLADDPGSERRACDRHLAYFAALLHEHGPAVQRGDAAAIRLIAESIDDVRAAWSYAAASGNVSSLMRAMDGLFHFYEARGWAREGAEAFGSTTASEIGSGPTVGGDRLGRIAAARLAARHGVFLQRLGELHQADARLSGAVAEARDLDDDEESVFATHRHGVVRHGMGDYDGAEQLHREGWALAECLGDRHGIAWSMTYLGNVHWSRGEFDEATRLYTDALALMRETRDVNGTWVTVNNLGVLAASRQQYEEAQRRFREGLELQAELRNPRLRAHVLHNLGSGARELGDTRQAREWLEESLEISERLGYRSMAGLTLVGLAELAIREDDEAAAVTALHRALRTAGAARNHPLALEALLALARLRLRQGDRSGASELASIVAGHPGSDRDLRRNTADLFREMGREPVATEDFDLAALIAQIVGTRVGPPAVAAVATPHPPRRRSTLNAHATEDT